MITYVHSDVSAVADLLRDQVVVHDDRDMGRETAQEGRFGYASRHLLIGLDAARDGHPSYELMRGHAAQVQIRTVLQHAWAEFEHDIRYKGTMPDEHARDFDRRFTLAAGLLELADREFSTIRDTLRASAASASETEGDTDDDPRIDPRELAAFLAGQYAEAGWSRTDHYAWISGLLLELGIVSLDELGETLRAGDEGLIAERMDYRYPPGAVRRLDDALLAAYGTAYVELPGNAHRRAALESRLDRLTGNVARLVSWSVGHVDVHVVAVLEDGDHLCRTARGVDRVLPPALHRAPVRPDAPVEDHRVHRQPVGMGHEVLRGRPPLRAVALVHRPEEHVDGTPLVVRRPGHVSAGHPTGSEATHPLRSEGPIEVAPYGGGTRGEPGTVQPVPLLLVRTAVLAGQGVRRPSGEGGGNDPGVSLRDVQGFGDGGGCLRRGQPAPHGTGQTDAASSASSVVRSTVRSPALTVQSTTPGTQR